MSCVCIVIGNGSGQHRVVHAPSVAIRLAKVFVSSIFLVYSLLFFNCWIRNLVMIPKQWVCKAVQFAYIFTVELGCALSGHHICQTRSQCKSIISFAANDSLRPTSWAFSMMSYMLIDLWPGLYCVHMVFPLAVWVTDSLAHLREQVW